MFETRHLTQKQEQTIKDKYPDKSITLIDIAKEVGIGTVNLHKKASELNVHRPVTEKIEKPKPKKRVKKTKPKKKVKLAFRSEPVQSVVQSPPNPNPEQQTTDSTGTVSSSIPPIVYTPKDDGKYIATTATHKVAAMSKRIRAIQGGTSASKSISILLILIHMAQTDKKPTLTSIVSESLPHLKKGLIRDFLLIMNAHGYYKDTRWNRTDFTYTFETNSKLEFFSVDQPDKVRGPRRDRLFINEANNVHYESFDQLTLRTKEFVYLDWNPTNEFWFYSEVLPNRTDVEHITLTYKDNEALSKGIVQDIEQHKNNIRWWKVYGLGELGEVDGKIYKDWAIIDEIPHEAHLLRYGVDFGYTDPTSIVAVYEYNGGYIVDEIAFEKEMSISTISSILWNKDRALIIADSAQPGSIADIAKSGLTIIGAEKGRDSVENGINILQEQRISITSTSINIIKEYRNYMWEKDKLGKTLSIPEHEYSHSMDAVRYGIVSIIKRGSGATPIINYANSVRYGQKKKNNIYSMR